MSTTFRNHFMRLSADERERYAQAAGTTALYIKTHLISVPPRKVPRTDLMHGLAEASDGALTLADVLEHFYGQANAA